MGTPLIGDLLLGLNIINGWIPGPVKLLIFLALITGGVIIVIPGVNLNFFGIIEFLVSSIGSSLGFKLSILGFVILVFLGVPTIFALKYGRVHS